MAPMLGHRPDAEATDRALNALSHACRRRLLFELYETAGSGEESVAYSDIPLYREESRRVELYHTHLPKLEASGYVEWNEAEETARKGPRWNEIEPILDLVYTHLCELPPSLRGKPPQGNGTQC